MKKLFKNNVFTGILVAVIIMAITMTAVLLMPGKAPIDVDSQTSETSDIMVNVPEISTPSETSVASDQPDKEVVSDLVVDVGNTKETDKNTDSSKASTPNKPVTEVQPKDTGNDNNSSGIQIGGGVSTDKYNCGSPNHHCKNAEAHA